MESNTFTTSNSEKTEIMHIGDVHLGNRQYSSDKRKQDYYDAFHEAITISIKEEVDAVIHTGDLFDSPQPDITTVGQCMDELERLEEHNIPFFGIVGNHERKWDQQWMDILNKSNNAYRLSQSPVTAENVAIYGIDALRRTEWDDEENFNLEDPPENTNVVVCMHELLTPLVNEDIADSSVQDVLSKLSLTPDVLALGDSHTPDEATIDDCLAYYPGVLEKTSISDSPDHKVVKLTFSDTVEKQDYQLQNTRPLKNITLESTVDMTEAQIKEVLENSGLSTYNPNEKSPLCVIEIVGDKPETVSINRMKELALETGAEIVHILDRTDFEGSDIPEDVEEISGTSIEESIEQKTSEKDFSKTSSVIKDIVESPDSVKDSVVREETTRIVQGDNNED